MLNVMDINKIKYNQHRVNDSLDLVDIALSQ